MSRLRLINLFGSSTGSIVEPTTDGRINVTVQDSTGGALFQSTNPGYVNVLNSGSTTKNATNLVTVTTSSTGTVILAANSNRKSYFIQNNGTVPVILAFNEVPSTTNYSKILTAGSGVRTGDGGSDNDDNITTVWKGSIYGITETGSAVISIFEKE